MHLLNRALSNEETLPNKTLDWSPTMVAAFDRAKELLSVKVLTHLPDMTKPFILTADASGSSRVLGAAGTRRTRTSDRLFL